MNGKKFIKSEYDREYNKLNYKQLKANIKPIEFDSITNFCESKSISKASFIVAACRYFIDRDILPPKD